MIDASTTLAELAVLISMTLERAEITATLSGGAAVSIYSRNAYESADLDFVTSERNRVLRDVVAELGFRQSGSSRLFEHPDSDWLVEFPPGPLSFGDTHVDAEDLPVLETEYGPLRIITPTLSVLDRLAACWYHHDRQTWDQAIEVARRQTIDWNEVYAWAEREGRGRADVDRLRALTSR